MKSTPVMKSLSLLLALSLCKSAASQQWDGLTLYSNMNSNTGFLLDTNSTAIKSWTFTGNTGYSTHMMPGGFIYRTVSNPGNALTGGGMTGRIQKLDYNGTILWDYTYSSSTYCLHHDHCPLPNGNVLVISYDVKTATDATNAGSNSAIVIWSEKVMELQPVGTNSANVVWEWKLWDHTVQNVNSALPNYKASIVDNPQLLNINYSTQKDWIHMNGVDYNPLLDQIVVSSHNLNEWYIIDHSTTTAEAASHSGGLSGKGGDFLYRWGNPAAYSATGTKILNVTHDAHWVPDNCPNGGYLAGINNKGVTSPSTKTTADIVNAPRSGYNYTMTPGSAYSPTSYFSRHTSTGYTSNMGSCDQFPNGNQLICLATAGSIYEIDANGTTLWTKSTGGMTPQAHRYTTCYINNAAPPQPSITVNGTVLASTSASSYQWYRNGDLITGATSQNFTPTLSGVYVVKVTDSNGCLYAYSVGKTFTTTTPVDTRLNENNLAVNTNLYPNPTSGMLSIEINTATVSSFVIRVYDNMGKLILQDRNVESIDLSSLSPGFYIVNITSDKGEFANKKINLVK